MDHVAEIMEVLDELKDLITSGTYLDLSTRLQTSWKLLKKAQIDNFARVFGSGSYNGCVSDGNNCLKFKNGKLHGHCSIDGNQYWYDYGLLHRLKILLELRRNRNYS